MSLGGGGTFSPVPLAAQLSIGGFRLGAAPSEIRHRRLFVVSAAAPDLSA